MIFMKNHDVIKCTVTVYVSVIPYLADRAVVEEEAGTDTGTHSPGDQAGTQPAQNTPHH